MVRRRQHHVLRLDVAVHDTVAVRFGQRVGHLRADGDGRRQFEGRLLQAVGKGVAVDILHGDEATAVDFSDFEHRADVGMLQRGRGARFTQQPLARGVVCEIRREDLQGDATAQPGVFREVDLAHAACSERRLDDEWADARPGSQRHIWTRGITGPSYLTITSPTASGPPTRNLET